MSSLLITGGTGSLGRALTARLLAEGEVSRLVILSRDEVKQAEMREAYRDRRLRFFLGDVRDRDRLELAFHGIETVIHAASLKRVETGVYEPEEMVKTNLQGTINVIRAAVTADVLRVLVVSSDKAPAPETLYGATKFLAERFALAANSFAFPKRTWIGAIRYGNVVDSRGAALHRFRAQAQAGEALEVTDPGCTRFLLTLEQAAGFALEAAARFGAGELWVPADLPAASIGDLAEAVAPGHPVKTIGLRPGGEKVHEVLLTPQEAQQAIRVGRFWVVPPGNPTWRYAPPDGERAPADFRYSSDAVRMLSVEEIRELVGEGSCGGR